MNFLQTIETDGEAALADVKKGLVYLETEGATIIAWVEKEVPSAAPAIAQFLQVAEVATSNLATVGANGLSSAITSGLDDMETFLLNFITNSGFSKNVQGSLTQIDASAVALVNTVGQNMVSTSLASLLAKIAPAPSGAAAPASTTTASFSPAPVVTPLPQATPDAEVMHV